MRIDGVIFDWDGTLADTQQVVVTSFQRVMHTLGCRVNSDFITRRIGIGTANVFKDALKTANIPFNEAGIKDLVNKKTAQQMLLLEKVDLFDGAVELLGALQNKVKIALASMSNRRVIDQLLRNKMIGKYFDSILTADEVKHPKPDPEIFLKSAENLRCHPEDCVVIEDSIFGVKAARAATMRCIAVLSGAYSKTEISKERPDLIVDSLQIHDREKIVAFILDGTEAIPF